MWLEPLGKLEGAKSAVYGMAYDNNYDEVRRVQRGCGTVAVSSGGLSCWVVAWR